MLRSRAGCRLLAALGRGMPHYSATAAAIIDATPSARLTAGRALSAVAAALACWTAVSQDDTATALRHVSAGQRSLSAPSLALFLRRVAAASKHLVQLPVLWKAHESRVRWRQLDAEAAAADASATHTDIAGRLRALALELGGIYIKGGQHICAQPSLPLEYVCILSTLMSMAQAEKPHSTLSEDEATFEEDTGLAMRSAFASFEPTPVASASLAQVYRAVLPSGEAVAVKIQRREVARFLQTDLWTIEVFYDLIARLIPGLRLGWLAAETRRHMGEELDFVSERRNAEEAARMLGAEFPPSVLVVPRMHSPLCGRRVLTMGWVDGVRIDDLPALQEQRADIRRLATVVQAAFARMIFVDGFVHCDPHPGNILVCPNGAIALLDHGIYRRLGSELRRDFARLWLAVLAGDRERIQACTATLGMPPEQWRFVALMVALSPGAVKEDESSLLLTEDGGERAAAAMSNADRAEAARRLLALTGGVEAQSRLFESIPKDLLLVLKTNNLLRHVNERLGSPVNRFRLALPYALAGAEEEVGRWRSLRVRIGAMAAPLLRRMEKVRKL